MQSTYIQKLHSPKNNFK